MDWAKEEARWKETIEKLHVSFIDCCAKGVAIVPHESFEKLDDYSCSVPTGTVIGKIWRRGEPFEGPRTWWLGQYVKADNLNYVDIKWRELYVIVDHKLASGVHRATDELLDAIKTCDTMADTVQPANVAP